MKCFGYFAIEFGSGLCKCEFLLNLKTHPLRDIITIVDTSTKRNTQILDPNHKITTNKACFFQRAKCCISLLLYLARIHCLAAHL